MDGQQLSGVSGLCGLDPVDHHHLTEMGARKQRPAFRFFSTRPEGQVGRGGEEGGTVTPKDPYKVTKSHFDAVRPGGEAMEMYSKQPKKKPK